MNGVEARVAHARTAFRAACRLDVAVRKPGNVSVASPGHGMQAAQFVDSAEAAAGPLFEPGAPVGRRIEGAVAASWARVGCNTNLGIVLLCAPLGAAFEAAGAGGLRPALDETLDRLDLDDARATFRAIVQARPGGLGDAPAQDVRTDPSVGLRAAMRLAADRDLIARQYAGGFAELFDTAATLLPQGFSLMAAADATTVSPTLTEAVLRVYLHWLAGWPDSHIVRKHGEAVAHTVMRAAQAWQGQARPQDDPGFAAWDEELKAQRINPGTSADLTVATLLLAALRADHDAAWHGK
ncbi:MAG: triphosphoribosyl-dephospho-CoA synthase [Piscinibacter sp.]|nr:triphosphoribosyl-dephospho-CoA synthase [Piscinibacter sp.]